MEALSPADLQPILDEIAHAMASATDRGEPATYIPELGCINPDQFGIALCLPGGQVLQAGDAATPFSIQSISKVFTLAIALGRLGDSLWSRVGREPSGLAFNSIVSLEQNNGIPRNPFVNPGAIAVTDAILHGLQPRDVLAELLRFLRTAAEDNDIHIDKDVALSELAHAHRNIAMAEFMAAHGNLQNPSALTIGTYCHQCAVEMSCVQLARAGRFLAGFPDAARLVSPARVRRINALMLTCGHYDASGDFAYRVGLPGKSGVGGGILAIAPGRASIAVWSPGLNAQGNSKLGAEAMEHLAHATGWSVFG
ncbi:MAG: glutaminase [Pseudotabrizicola sp.]|uniref:glutaminase n=1 Tax=Pseudotabrizicola sp. TaxID=2939647 RepID=UPI002723DCF8|nr:glutaminase [Pseudotabrizicola sp.]MDO8883278.1 glutaminase [Pseudotabrizicola sp.]MDP2082948.1 glutaminase [Pseudotabrizicola sp.]MDZ7574480.1 glutaminase [Pseudotabrizicola sp.]